MPTQPGNPVTSNHPYMDKVHKIYSSDWVYADATARLADTGFIAEDIGRVAQQDSPKSWWVLTNHSPITWQAMGGSGIGEIIIRKNGGPDLGPRPRLNFIEGANITITAADDPGNSEVDITIAAAASPGFPFNVFTLDLTDPDADFATMAAAAAGMAEGDVLLVGPGEYDCDEVDLPAGIRVIGMGGGGAGYVDGVTRLRNAVQTSFYTLGITGNAADDYTRLISLEIICQSNNSGVDIGGLLAIAGGGNDPYLSLVDCHVFGRNQDAGVDGYCLLGDWSEVDITDGFYEAYADGGTPYFAEGNTYLWCLGLPSLPNDLGPLTVGTGLAQSQGSNGIRLINSSDTIRVEAFSTDGTLVSNSDVELPTVQAVKTYVDSQAKFDIVEMLPGLRGWWTMGRLTAAGLIGDASHNDLHLTRNGGVVVGRSDGHSYIILDGVDDYLSIANTALIDIEGTEAELESAARGFSIAGWVYFDGAAAADEFIAGKFDENGGGADLFSWVLYRDAVGRLIFTIINPADATTHIFTSDATIPATTWTYVAVVFEPAVEVRRWVGATKKTTATAVAALDSVAAPLTFGVAYDSVGAPVSWMAGRESNFLLCAANLTDQMVDTFRIQTQGLYL